MNGEATATISDRQTLPEGVLQSLTDLIQERGLKIGDQLPSIRELAQRLDARPTTVRDALLRAQALGFVHILPRAGAFLRGALPTYGKPAAQPEEDRSAMCQVDPIPEPTNQFHLLDARRLIEIELVGRSAERRRLEDLLPVRRALEAMLRLPETAPRSEYIQHDIRFHVEIARLAGNDVLFGIQRNLMEQLRPHLNEVPPTRERRGRADRSHAAIYAALVAGDVERARDEMRQHLSLAYDGLLRDIQEPPMVKKAVAL